MAVKPRRESFPSSEAMMEIIILGIVITMLMAKKRGRRRNKNFAVLQASNSIVLATLATFDVLGEELFGGNQTLLENYRAYSVDVLASIVDLTAGEGPITFGVAHADYTDAEIEEALETNFLGPANLTQKEKMGRMVRRIGQFDGETTHQRLRDGKPIRVKLGWDLHSGTEGIRFWAYNETGNTLTTGALIRFNARVYGHWIL